MEKIAERLKKLIKEERITPYKLSKETNINLQTIINILDGKSEPKASTIIKICNYFNIQADYLLGRQEYY